MNPIYLGLRIAIIGGYDNKKTAQLIRCIELLINCEVEQRNMIEITPGDCSGLLRMGSAMNIDKKSRRKGQRRFREEGW